MSKLFHYLICLAGVFLLTGCYLTDPKNSILNPFAKKEPVTIKGKIVNIKKPIFLSGDIINIVVDTKFPNMIHFELDNPADQKLLAQIEINDYIDYYIDYDKKFIKYELTKKSEENCKIKLFIEFDDNYNQKIIEFGYTKDKVKNGVDICNKYKLKEAKNVVNFSGKNEYIE